MSDETSPPLSELQAAVDFYLHYEIFTCFLAGIYSAVFIFFITHAFITRHEDKSTTRSMITAAVALQYGLLMSSSIGSWYRFGQSMKYESIEEIALDLFSPSVATIVWINTNIYASVVIADALIVWRCWKIWNRNMWIGVPLAFLSVVAIGMYTYGIYLQAIVPTTTSDRVLYIDNVIATTINFLGAGITIVASMLILTRIYAIGRKEGVRKFRLVVELVVESAIIYSVPFLALGIWDVATPVDAALDVTFAILNGFIRIMVGLAPLLLVVRIHMGMSRPESVWEEPISFKWSHTEGSSLKEEGGDAQEMPDLLNGFGGMSGSASKELTTGLSRVAGRLDRDAETSGADTTTGGYIVEVNRDQSTAH